jgi:hypothetical protein
MSQTIRGPYVNQRSRKLLEQRNQRMSSQQRVEEPLLKKSTSMANSAVK